MILGPTLSFRSYSLLEKDYKEISQSSQKSPNLRGTCYFFLLLSQHSGKEKKDVFSEGNAVVRERVEIKFPNICSTRNSLRKAISSVEQQEHFLTFKESNREIPTLSEVKQMKTKLVLIS